MLINIKVFVEKPYVFAFPILSILNPKAKLIRLFEMLELSKYKVLGVFVTHKSMCSSEDRLSICRLVSKNIERGEIEMTLIF